MRGLIPTLAGTSTDTDLVDRAVATLARRLDTDRDRPLALALSGGGDSVALLAVVMDWARANGRRVLALTVDHRIQPASAEWTRFAGEVAAALGADWRALRWDAPKPSSGLPAAARAARHALLARTAHAAGAGVLLLGHTEDDVRESALMRADGSSLGGLRDWSPSPVWPEGRDLFLLRPLLHARRADLRALLAARRLSWLEDPANADPAYARARARVRLAAGGVEPAARVNATTNATGTARLASACTEDGAGGLAFERLHLTTGDASRAVLGAALLSVAGGTRPARSAQLDRVLERLRSGEIFTATLAGARIEAGADAVRLVRDAGEASRGGGLETMRIFPGHASVWDGRFEITAETDGLLEPARGRMNLLDAKDRKEIRQFPASARAGLPLFRPLGAERPVLAWRRGRVHSLAGPRFRAACGLIAHERDITGPPRGAEVGASLC